MLPISDAQRRARLARRHALAVPAASVEAATAAMTCLHATEPASVHLAAFARSGAAIEDVDRALYDDRTVVKQLAMRRTVFVFPRDLLPAVWGSAAARVAAQQRARLARDVEKAGIAADGPRWVEQTTTAVLALLHQHGPLTTTELRSHLPELGSRLVVSPGKKYGGEFPIASRVLTTLAASGAVVRGPNEGSWKISRPRWTPTADWIEVGLPLSEADGYAALVRSWLHTFGPGTEDDLVWWLGATRTAVRRALADVEAVEVRLDHGTGWVRPDDLPGESGDSADEPVEAWASLLPALDPTTMGWKDRAFYLGDHAERLVVDRRRRLGDADAAIAAAVDQDEVGEGAADIDAGHHVAPGAILIHRRKPKSLDYGYVSDWKGFSLPDLDMKIICILIIPAGKGPDGLKPGTGCLLDRFGAARYRLATLTQEAVPQ